MDFLEVVMPIIVFVIWIGASILGLGKKKRPQPAPTQNRQGTPPQQPSRPPSMFEEFKRSIQTAVEEMQEVNRTDTPLPEYESAETVAERESVERYTPEAVSEINRKPIPVTVAPVIKRPVSPTMSNACPKKTLTREQVRQGIILAEILAPPLALREK